MKITSGTTDQFLYFVALDATDLKTRETGLTSFTVYRSRNGAAAVAMTTPTVNETDATNMQGVYELLLDEDMTIGAGNDDEEMIFHITQASMAPVDRVIDLYRPKITVGETVGATSGAIDDVTLVATTTANTDMRGTDSANTVVPPSVSQFNARTLVAADYFDPAADAVANVTLVDTTTANTDMRGTDSAATATALATVDGNVDAILVDTGTTIPAQISALNDVAATDIVSAGAITTLSGSVVNVDLVDTTTVNTDMVGTDGANTTAPDNAGITANGVAIAALNDITAADVLVAGDIDGFNLEDSQKIILSAAGGKLSGAATSTNILRAADDSKARITATVDSDGNRSAVTLDGTG